MSESAAKALDLLFYLARAGGQVTLARLSRETGMNKATALRYLAALESRGVAERQGGGWSLGLALFELGNQVPVRTIVVDRIRPILERLSRDSGESANLACLAGSTAIYLDRVEADRSLRMRVAPGDRLPLHATGVGKAILSLLPDERLPSIVGTGPLPRYTDTTITDASELLRECVRTREQGYGLDREEYEVGLTCIAMPLRLPGSDFAGSISVSGPTARIKDPAIRERFIRLLHAAVTAASASLANAALVERVVPPRSDPAGF